MERELDGKKKKKGFKEVMPPLSLLSWPVCSVMLNIFSLVLHSAYQSPWYYSQGSSLREEAFFFGFWKFFYAGRKSKGRMICFYRYSQSALSGLLCVPLGITGKKEEWLERQNEPLKEAERHSELVTHNCLLLASRKMPLKAERRNHFAGSKGKDSPATFSHSFF